MAFKTPTLADFNKLSTAQEKMVLLLDNTIKYYSEDTKRRAMNGEGKCYYRVGKNACAIGRFLTKDKAEFCDAQMNNAVGGIYGHLPFILTQFNKFFLKEIQALHDKAENWNDKNGLSKDGIAKVGDIKREFKLEGIEL